jgi:hypothetical protein
VSNKTNRKDKNAEDDDDDGNGGGSVASSVVRCTNPNYMQSKPVRLQSANTRKNNEEAARIDRVRWGHGVVVLWCCVMPQRTV